MIKAKLIDEQQSVNKAINLSTVTVILLPGSEVSCFYLVFYFVFAWRK